jgi:hypothetical protein
MSLNDQQEQGVVDQDLELMKIELKKQVVKDGEVLF